MLQNIHSSPCRVILSCVVLDCHTLTLVNRFLEGHNIVLCTQTMLQYDQHFATPAQVNLVSCLSARQCLLSAAFMDCRYTCCQYTSSLLTTSTAQQSDEQGPAALCAPTVPPGLCDILDCLQPPSLLSRHCIMCHCRGAVTELASVVFGTWAPDSGVGLIAAKSCRPAAHQANCSGLKLVCPCLSLP